MCLSADSAHHLPLPLPGGLCRDHLHGKSLKEVLDVRRFVADVWSSALCPQLADVVTAAALYAAAKDYNKQVVRKLQNLCT